MSGIHTQRLKCDRAARLSQISLTAAMWAGRATRFELGLFAGLILADVDSISSLTLRVKDSRESAGVELMAATVDGASLTEITTAQWTAGTHQHAVIEFTNEECNLPVVGDKQEYWMTVEALLENGYRVIYGAGKLTVCQANADQVGPPPENPSPGISLAEADARYLRGPFRLTLSDTDSHVHVYSPSGTYHGSLGLLDLEMPDLDP